MITFTKEPEKDNQYDVATVKMSMSSDIVLTEIIAQIDLFLRACGYSFDGELDLVFKDEGDGKNASKNI
jgi:hypothetical protein